MESVIFPSSTAVLGLSSKRSLFPPTAVPVSTMRIFAESKEEIYSSDEPVILQDYEEGPIHDATNEMVDGSHLVGMVAEEATETTVCMPSQHDDNSSLEHRESELAAVHPINDRVNDATLVVPREDATYDYDEDTAATDLVINGNDEAISNDSDDSSEGDEPPCCILEYKSFYQLFRALPHTPPAALAAEHESLRNDSDDDVLYFGGYNDDEDVFHSPLISLTLALRNSFKIQNDITIEFPALNLSFPECRLHEFSNLSMSKLWGYHSALSKSSPVGPLRILLLEHATSLDKQLRHLEELYQLAGQGVETIEDDVELEDGSKADASATTEIIEDIEEQDYEDGFETAPIHESHPCLDPEIYPAASLDEVELIDYEDDDREPELQHARIGKKHALEDNDDTEINTVEGQPTNCEGVKKQRID